MEKRIYFNGLPASCHGPGKRRDADGQQQGGQPERHEQLVQCEASNSMHMDLRVRFPVSIFMRVRGNRTNSAFEAETAGFGAGILGEMHDIVSGLFDR